MHAQATLRAVAKLHARYWGYSPAHNKDFLVDEAEKMVPFFRHVVVPGLRLAGEMVPEVWQHLDPLVSAFGTKMANIAARYLYPHGAPVTLGFADLKYDSIWFSHKGETVDGIENCINFRPMWAHPLADVAAFVVRSFDPDERKAVEKEALQDYHQTLVDDGIDDYTFDQCWEDYVHRMAHLTSVAIASLAHEAKTGSSAQTTSLAIELTTRLAMAVRDHNIAAKFGALENDAL